VRFRVSTSFMGGSSLQGAVLTTFNTLVQLFGQPEYWNDECAADWSIEFEDGTQATVYIYKPVEHGLRSGQIPKRKFLWHVGGVNTDAVTRVAEVLEVEPICWGYSAYDPDEIPF